MKKKALAVAVASTLAVPMAAQAINYKISGQVNRAIMFADDGEGSDFLNVDNDNSSTRFRFVGSEDIGGGLTAGIRWEVEMESNASSQVTIKQAGDNNESFTERWIEVFFEGDWGKLQLGQGAGAGDGNTERDLSGTTVAALGARNYWGGGIRFRRSDNGDEAQAVDSSGNMTFVRVGNSLTSFDGFGRYDRVMYTTPVIGPGITASVSIGNNHLWEANASIRTSLAGGKLDGAFFYTDANNRAEDTLFGDVAEGLKVYGGSASYLFGEGLVEGLSLTVNGALAEVDAPARDDATSIGAKIGYQWGFNAIAFDWMETKEFFSNEVDNTTLAVSWVYTLPKPKIELYATWRNFDADIDNLGTEDINLVAVGSRIKF